jgi:hypothetical protein
LQYEGNLRAYSLRSPRIARMLELVEEFYDVHLENLRKVIELKLADRRLIYCVTAREAVYNQDN